MADTVIQAHTTAIVRALIERVDALSSLQHNLTKGELRELFVTTVLRSFLTAQFGVGSGIVINQRGDQSAQEDIIIYDRRILPPFISEENLGVFPAESVLATIEVKSYLRKHELLAADGAAKTLHHIVHAPRSRVNETDPLVGPFCAVIGFYGRGVKELADPERGVQWLERHVAHIGFICLAGQYSWLRLEGPGWVGGEADEATCEETKAFIAVLLDNVRTLSEDRLVLMREQHKDWLSIYTRSQDLFADSSLGT